jgi:hypothetical protein
VYQDARVDRCRYKQLQIIGYLVNDNGVLGEFSLRYTVKFAEVLISRSSLD